MRAPGWGRTALAVGLTAALAGAAQFAVGAQAGHAASSPPRPPRPGAAQVVDQADVGDPFILTVGSTYYLFGTTDWESNVPAATSTDLVHWQAAPDALPVLPAWAAPSISMTWAPAVMATGGRYVMYVATEEAASGRQCIAAATASTPSGPYADTSSRPFLCQRSLGGSIDPSVVSDSHGGHHLVWKSDGNCCHVTTALWEQDLSNDGLHLVGATHRLLGAAAAWEQGNVEAPSMVAAPRGWWLFYSAGDWRSASYATGVAWCPTVEGPCRDVVDRPLLPSTAEMRTPSGVETFRDRSGHLWMAFTTTVLVPSQRHRHHVYANRVLDVAPLDAA
jgi:beta-xylosidase